MSINLEVLAKYFAQKGPVILLESQSADHPWSQKSYLAALPKAQISARDNHISIIRNGEEIRKSDNPWKALQEFRKHYGDWLLGYLGYDLKNHLEELGSHNPDSVQAPDLYFMVPGFLLEIDESTGEKKILRGNLPDISETTGVTSRESPGCKLANLRCSTSEGEYLQKISKAQQQITEGDFYEINLSHQMVGDFQGDPFELYQKMKKIGPVPFGTYLSADNFVVCCQSPERFLRKEGTSVFSQPIKGTSQRGQDSVKDKKLKQRLLSSQKEQAENLMIVDLVRNDLSRIAKAGSVTVPELFRIQSFGTVHQMVSTVSAEAWEDDPIEILKACFPMGSMTGAPKISAMKMIEELEDYRRGIYSGAIGYITPDDNFDFNVVIRTAIIRQSNLFYSVGGAITSDSEPEEEWQETLIKARALTDIVAKREGYNFTTQKTD